MSKAATTSTLKFCNLTAAY